MNASAMPLLLFPLALFGLTACEPAPTTSDTPVAADATGESGLAALEAPDPAGLVDGAPKGRLPAGVRPLAYDLSMTIDPREERFSGSVTIEIARDTGGDGIWLHGRDLDVSQVFVETGAGAAREATYTQVLPSGVSWVDFGGPLAAGTVKVTLIYSAAFNKNLAGLFRVEEQGEAYALAKSESIQARNFLPGFDEPGLKAPFTVSLRIPEGHVAIANTPERTREAAEGGMQWVHFAPTRPLSTFLLSLAVGPFDIVDRPALPPTEIRDRAVPLRGIARKGKGGELGLILDITRDFMEIFEEALGVPYPYAKLDIVAAPQWPSGATELAGAISYREQLILLGDDPAPGARRRMLSLHAHELAHMWFGNLVTPPWWDDLWLKEGFATWGTPLVLTQWEPDGGHGLDAIDRALGAMKRDSLASARSVREPIGINEDVRNAYTPIPYGKGMALIRMVETYFGAPAFRRSLGGYIRTYEDGAANSPQFFETIGKVTGVPELTESFESFVEQPGVPLIEAALDCTGAQPVVSLRQSRYAPLGSPIEQGQRWTVPICVRHGGDGESGRTCVLLGGDSASLLLETESCPAWIHPNAQGTGYYRWSLPAEGWQALSAGYAGLEAGEVLTAVDSALASFDAGVNGFPAIAGLLRQAAGDPTRQVATAPMGALSRYIDIAGDSAVAARLKTFAAMLYASRLDALETPSTADETLLKTELEAFLALTVEDAGVRARLLEAAYRFIGRGGERDDRALTSDQYASALTVAVQDGGAPVVDALIAARTEIDDPRFEADSATALGNVGDEALAPQIRAYALSGTPGPREAYTIIGALMDDAATREATWDWARENIAAIVDAIPGQWRRRLPTLAGGFCAVDRIAEVEAFFTQNAGLMPGHERQLTQTVESIRLCAALKAHLLAQDLSGL